MKLDSWKLPTVASGLDRGLKHRLSRKPEVAILVAATLIAIGIGALAYTNANQTRTRVVQARRVRDIQKLNAQLLTLVTAAETGQRGYLLTGRSEYLRPYDRAVSAIPQILQRLADRAAPTQYQAERIKALEPLVTEKLAELKDTIELGKSKNMEQAIARVNAGRGAALMEDIRTRSTAIDQAATQKTAEFSAATDRSTSQLRLGGALGSILLLGLVFLSAAIISRSLRRREDLFEQAQATRELLATTLSSIADGVISTDSRGGITFMNPVAERLTGWKEPEAAGLPVSNVFSIVNEATRETVVNPIERAIALGEVVGLANHTKLIAKDGSEIYIDDSAAPIRDTDGGIIGAVLVFRDVSEKRRSELELTESAAALKRSNEELQQFAFAASHDLRSPLNSVNSIAQLLARRFGASLGADGAEMIGYITEGLHRMSRLVDDLLALALASGIARDVTQPNDMLPTDMEDAFQAAIQGLSAEIQQTGAVITSSPLPLLAVHDTHVVQVTQNILGNALKYRGTEPPRIHLSAAQDGSNWIIGVKDNGIGFDRKYAEQIFQPFKRLHGHDYEGSGIGLATCKKIVAAYGGRIWAESEPGNGATFYFSLPAAQQSKAAPSKEVNDFLQAIAAAPGRSSETPRS